ncbi:MAG: hypothetical protein JWM91_4758 [Rhodospirillales bacterium]|nr:hypothetical protein [Rhodospirillales bacterium]
MKFETAADLFFVVSVFVPGFIYYAVLSAFVPARDTTSKETTLLRLFIGTALNYGLCSPIIYLLLIGALFASSPIARGITWLGIIFVAPIIIALISARLSQARATKWVAGKLGLRSISPIPTGWDWIFGLEDPLYLIVTLTDGTKLAGFFGEDSMASSVDDRKDLYLEKAFTIPETGPWQEVPSSRGTYIEGSQIAFIEFRS